MLVGIVYLFVYCSISESNSGGLYMPDGGLGTMDVILIFCISCLLQ